MRILARILYARRYAKLTQRAEELTRRIYLRRVQHKEWKPLANEKAKVMHERMALELRMGL